MNRRRITRRILALAVVALRLPTAQASDAGPGDELFADGVVTHLRVEVAAPEMEILRSFAFQRDVKQEERPSVRCVVREGTNTWGDVALHLKGSAGSFRSVDDTPSFTLNFSKHLPEQRFHGLDKISLNTSVQDPTKVSEKLSRELYTRGGIAVPRAGYATAEWNGRRLGFYVLLEGWSRQFVQRHFADARGPLYEGRFLSDIDQPPKIAYGNTNGTSASIAQLLAAVREPVPSQRLSRLEAVLDLDRFTRLLALDVLAWNGDGYAFHANNYRILHDRSQERFVFLAHGLDQVFYLPDAPVLASGDGLVATAVLSLPECRQRVLDRIREFRRSFFQPEAIRQRGLQVGAQVSQALARLAGVTNANASADPSVLDWLQRMSDRLASIDEQLIQITNHVVRQRGQTFLPPHWSNRALTGAPTFLMPSNSLTIRTSTNAAGAWVAQQWFEEGRYRLQGRVRRIPGPTTNLVACGFQVRAPRKRSLSTEWGWDGRRRVASDERFQLVTQALPPAAGTNWTELTCEIDLKQPMADLEILCAASGDGEAWFDLQSLKLTRLTDPGRDSGVR